MPASVSTSNVRAVLRLPRLRVLDLSQATVVNEQGDVDDMESGWVSAVRAAGHLGERVEVLLMPRSGGQIDDVLKLMHSQVKMEPVEAAGVEERKEATKDGKDENEDVSSDEKQGSSEVEVIHSASAAVTQGSPVIDDESKEPYEWVWEKRKSHFEATWQSEAGLLAAVESVAAAEAKLAAAELAEAHEEKAADAADGEDIPDAPPLAEGAAFWPYRVPPMVMPAPAPARYADMEEKQKAEEKLAEQLRRAATPPPTASGRRKKPTPVPCNIRYLSISGQLSVAGMHSLAKLPHLHTLLFDYYQLSSTGDVFDAFVECAQDRFAQLRVLRLCDWSDELAANRRRRRATRKTVTERMTLMLTRFQQLEYLDMRFPPLCDVGQCLPAVFQLRNLRKLWLLDTQAVHGLPENEDEVKGQWRDEWVVGVSPAFPHLLEVNFSSLGVDESAVLSIIANAPKLLDASLLYSPEVTLASLFALSRHCPELRFLDVDGCANIALTTEGWELGHEKYRQWLAKQPNLLAASSSVTDTSLSLSSSTPPSPDAQDDLPSVPSTLSYQRLEFLYLTLSYDTDTDFTNLDTDGVTRLIDALSSSPLTHANISSEHLTSRHIGLLERWTQLRSLSAGTSGFGSQPRMAKTLLDYDGKAHTDDGQERNDDNADDNEDEEDEGDDNDEEEGDEGEEQHEKADEEEVKEEKKVPGVSDASGKEEKTDSDVKEARKEKKRRKAKKRADDGTTDDSAKPSVKFAADESESKEAKLEESEISAARSVAFGERLLLAPSSPAASGFCEADLDALHIYTRPTKRTPPQQSAHDRSVTTHAHLRTQPRTRLELELLRYEGGDGDESGAPVFGRTFRDDEVHDGMAGREAYFSDLRQHLGRDRKRGESELWKAVRGRARGRRRRYLGGRGGFGHFVR